MAENAGGFMGGLSEGLQQGTNMGYLRLQAQAMAQNQARQAQILQVEQEKAAFEQKQKMLESGVNTFKVLPKRMRQVFFQKNLAPMFEQVYGFKMDPTQYTDTVEKGVEDFHDLLKLKREGKIGQNDFLQLAAEIRASVTKDESTQIGDIMGDMPGSQKGGGKGFSVDALLTPEETKLYYKIQLGLKDDEIDAAVKAGKYPKQIRQGAAAMLKKGGTDWGAIASMMGGSTNADSVAGKNGF